MRIGIDLGGTKIEAAVLDDSGEIICRRRVPTPQQSYQGTLTAILKLLHRLELDCGLETARLPVGIGTPGSLSPLTGRMKNCNSTCLNGQPFFDDLRRLLKRDVRIANDADCFALSEALDGAANQQRHVFGVILGTGVGGGIVINKQLVSGPNGIAGEWGHNPLPPVPALFEGGDQIRRCYCGRSNCIETWLSGPALEHSFWRYANKRFNAAQIASAAVAGDAEAAKVMEYYCECLAAALATVINVIDPDVIVLGGGLSNIHLLYEELPKRWLRYVFNDGCATRLLPAKFGDSSGVRGAARLW